MNSCHRIATTLSKPTARLHLARLCGVLGLAGCLLFSGIEPATAFGVFKKKKDGPEIENYEPPAADAEATQCEPLREKIVRLNDNTPRLMRIFIVPRREYLMRKHRECKANLMDQEFRYLKHADIKNPTLAPVSGAQKSEPQPSETAQPASSPVSPQTEARP